MERPRALAHPAAAAGSRAPAGRCSRRPSTRPIRQLATLAKSSRPTAASTAPSCCAKRLEHVAARRPAGEVASGGFEDDGVSIGGPASSPRGESRGIPPFVHLPPQRSRSVAWRERRVGTVWSTASRMDAGTGARTLRSRRTAAIGGVSLAKGRHRMCGVIGYTGVSETRRTTARTLRSCRTAAIRVASPWPKDGTGCAALSDIQGPETRQRACSADSSAWSIGGMTRRGSACGRRTASSSPRRWASSRT